MFTICFSLHKKRYRGDALDMQGERKVELTPVATLQNKTKENLLWSSGASDSGNRNMKLVTRR